MKKLLLVLVVCSLAMILFACTPKEQPKPS